MVVKRCRQFAGKQQQDAQEFLMVMLAQLSEFKLVFSGICKSIVTCLSCCHHSPKEDTFNCLLLEIPPSDSRSAVSLQDCLKQSFAEETIPDGWQCNSCGDQNAAVKKESLLLHLPELLIIQLKRFKPTLRGYVKDNSAVSLPKDELLLMNRKYQLVGLVNHCGSMVL